MVTASVRIAARRGQPRVGARAVTSIVILLMLASTGVLAAVEAVIVTIGSIQTVLGVVEAILVPSSSSPHVTGDLEAGVSARLVMALLTSGLSGLAPFPL